MKSRSKSKPRRSAQAAEPPRPNRRGWRTAILLGAVALGVSTAVFMVQSRRSQPSQARTWSFSDPAFTEDATSADFKTLASRTVDRLLDEIPDQAESHHAVARLHKSLGRSRLANQHWEQCVAIDKGFAKAYEGMAVVADEDSDFERATKMFREAIRLSPDDYLLPPLLADSLFKFGKFSEAVVVLREHMARQKTTAKALLTLGHSEFRLENYAEAKLAFEAMIDNFGDGSEKSALSTAYFGLWKVSMRLGEKKQALAYLEQHNKYAPVDEEIIEDNLKQDDRAWLRGVLIETLWGAGQVYQKYGRPDRAEELWQQTACLSSSDQACRLALLAQYEQAGRFADALRCAEQLRDIDPNIAEYWYNVGLLESRLGDFEAAREAISEALRLEPENNNFRQAYELIRE